MDCAFGAPFQDVVEQGNIIYSHKKGVIQCQSEINLSKEITILLTCLKENTEIKFQKVEKIKKEGLRLKVVMLVTDTSICASWIDVQEVNLPIEPISVNTFSLKGKQLYKSNGIRVLLKQ